MLPWALQKYCGVGHRWDTLLLGAARKPCSFCWPKGDFAIEHCKNTVDLGTAGIAMGTAEILWGWALQGYSAVGLCKNTLWLLLVTAGMFCGWALHGYFVVGHCKDALRLGVAGMLGGWALQGCFVVGHCRDALRLGPAVRLRPEGKDNIDFKI